jgi:hypothetical protein
VFSLAQISGTEEAEENRLLFRNMDKRITTSNRISANLTAMNKYINGNLDYVIQ